MAAIHIDGLTKHYGDVRALEGLTLDVEEGEVFGFLGPNGAGKTTTIRTLLGLLKPTDGDATLLGADVRDERALVEARRRIGYLPAEPGFPADVTGRAVLDYTAALRGDARSDELLEPFDPPLDRAVGEYSRGNRQKLAIVLAFAHDPDLVVMDEPTSGLDPLVQERFNEFVRAEAERGTTVFFSSHVLSEVRKVCDRVGIIRQGLLVAVERVETLLSRSGKRVRVRVEEAVGPETFDLPGVHDLELGEEVRFTYTGEYGPLLSRLADLTVRDLDVQEAPLDEVFGRFYDEGADPSAAAAEVDV